MLIDDYLNKNKINNVYEAKTMNLIRSGVCVILLLLLLRRGTGKVLSFLQDAQEYALEHNRTLENFAGN